jgi:hypothetical protein
MTMNNNDLDALLEPVGQTSGTYVKWEEPGDQITGTIVSFNIEGGTDFNDNPCPQLVLATNEGNVIINGSQANLRRNMTNGAPRLKAGHLCRVAFTGLYETPKGHGKEFAISVSPAPVLIDVDDTDF